MISVKCTGDFKKTEKFLIKMRTLSIEKILKKYGAKGVESLKKNTPVDTGETASKWTYKVQTSRTGSSITWLNGASAGSVPIVILLQYGHATNNGGYVSGVDFINPSLKTIFDNIADEAWKEVTNA